MVIWMLLYKGLFYVRGCGLGTSLTFRGWLVRLPMTTSSQGISHSPVERVVGHRGCRQVIARLVWWKKWSELHNWLDLTPVHSLLQSSVYRKRHACAFWHRTWPTVALIRATIAIVALIRAGTETTSFRTNNHAVLTSLLTWCAVRS